MINKELEGSQLDRQLMYINMCREKVNQLSNELKRPLKCCVQTFGCQMNARDSEKLLGILQEIGYEPTESEEADIVVYNTCTVRENANLRVYGRLGQLRGLKRKNPHMIIALCGCMMQEKEVVEKIQKSYSFVDVVFGTYNIFKLAELLYNRWESGKMVIDIWDSQKQVVEELPTVRKFPFKSGVNIMYGCNNFCTYCIVPYVRGREKSREPRDIIREIERLAGDGVKEIMLLGQNVNSYGKTLDNPVSFAQLLKEIEKIDGIERIRYMTPHPKDFSEELLDVMSQSSKICNHIHFPLQSGSTRLLKAMNRQYTKEQYLNWVEKIREKLPDVSLTTDIIVGFPGETREDFEDTLKVVNECKYDGAFTFIFSPRENTPAASFEDNVSLKEKEDRLHELNELINKYSKESNLKMLNKSVKVLITGVSEKDDTKVCGYTENMKLVNVDAPKEDIGKIINVKITEAKSFSLDGIKES